MPTHAENRARTREALVTATAALLREGLHPTIEQVAQRAGLSRATAYRHFPGMDDLLWQAQIARSIPPVAQTLADAGDDVSERVARCERALNGFLLSDPVGTRAFERTTLQRWLDHGPQATRRPARRLEYIDAALEPLVGRVEPEPLTRLRNALAVAIGTEATITLTDVCGLDVEQAHAVATWISQTLLAATLVDHDGQ